MHLKSSVLYLLRTFFLLALICCGFLAKSQNSTPPKSLAEIKAMSPSKEKVTSIMRYAKSPQAVYTAELKRLLQEALQFLSEEDRPEAIAPVISAIALAELNTGDEESAITYIKRAETYLPKLSGRFTMGLLSDISRVYNRTNNTEKIVLYFNKIENFTKENPEFIIPRVLNLRNWSNLEIRLGNHNKMLSNYDLALKLAKESKDERLIKDTRFNYAVALLAMRKEKQAFIILKELVPDLDNSFIDKRASFFEILCKNYRDVGDYKNAFLFAEKTYKLPEASSQQKSFAIAQMILSSFELQKFDNYEEYFRMLIKYDGNYNTLIALKNHRLAIGKYYEARNQTDKALKTYLAGYKLKMDGEWAPQEDVAFHLAIAGIYTNENNSTLAEKHLALANGIIKKITVPIPLKLRYLATVKKLHTISPLSQDSLMANLEKELRLKDTIHQKSLNKIANELETKYRVTEKEQQILLANQRERLGRVEIKQQKQQTLFISIGAITIIALLGTLTYIQLQRRKRNKLLYEASLTEIKSRHRLEIMDRLTEVQEQEKKRIAEQLHDEVGAMLSIAKLNINTLQEDLFTANSDAEKKLAITKQIMGDISETVRNISHTLMPIALEKYGFKKAIIDLLTAIKTANQINVEYVIEGLDHTNCWPNNFTLSAYRIIQEIINNVLKHAQATHLFVQLVELENALTIYIEDNGRGINQNADTKGAGMKLLESNIAYLSGKLEIKGQPNEGTFALIELPIPTLSSHEN
ncbi:MAG: hypothetical protein EOO47_12360 [Flavobacterium sp.]|nr:MAG: hypothetical protein EOO47_12360 [Flavobacterium sp.]